VWVLFEEAVSAREARQLGAALISHTCNATRQLQLSSYDRLFPNQDTLPKGGFGNLIALVKNIAFLMDRPGQWSRSPAFEITWSFNPNGDWTATHQMSVNDKREKFTRADLLAAGRSGQLKRGRTEAIAEEVIAAVRDWPLYAAEAGVSEDRYGEIQASHRLDLLHESLTPPRRWERSCVAPSLAHPLTAPQAHPHTHR
jgi:hypothetical protein